MKIMMPDFVSQRYDEEGEKGRKRGEVNEPGKRLRKRDEPRG